MAAETHFVALLRGINVGGNNLIKMADLKKCFEREGLDAVATFIASGNVLFSTTRTDRAALASQLEKVLASRFNYSASLVLRSHDELEKIVKKVPKGFGTEPDTYRYDVFFLKEPLTSREALKTVPAREGVDAVSGGPGALYFSRLISQATKSLMPKVVAMPLYKQMTIRNWNTTTKLLALLDAR